MDTEEPKQPKPEKHVSDKDKPLVDRVTEDLTAAMKAKDAARTGTLRMAKAALARSGESEFARTKLATARFYMAKVLPETGALFQSLMSGAKPVMELEAAAF